MKRARYKREPSKAICGPGGLRCPCCSQWLPAKGKKVANRALRRRDKIALKKSN